MMKRREEIKLMSEKGKEKKAFKKSEPKWEPDSSQIMTIAESLAKERKKKK